MRIACIHIPQFALQSATRINPALRGAPVAVVSGVSPSSSDDGAGRRAAGVLHAPIVLASSRAAWAQGVRLGMTATAARSQAPEIQIVTADAANDRETVRAIADALLGVSATVDIGGRVGMGGAHLAMYAEVPAKTRGTAFGDRLLEVLDELGLTGRIGIADDRFTAWVAAAHGGHEDTGVIAVPRGGSAAFLAPRPLSLLAISPEVQHMLEALGVRTLGEFAALPAPSIARPLDADYRALARGESDATLRPYVPDAPIREELTVSAGNVLELQDLLPAGQQVEGVSFGAAVAMLARRLELRLIGRGRGAARLDIVAIGKAGAREVPVTLEQGAADSERLAHVISAAIESISAEHAHDGFFPGRLRVIVAGEMIVGGETTEVFAEGSTRYAEPSTIYAVAADSMGEHHAIGAREASARNRDAHSDHAAFGDAYSSKRDGHAGGAVRHAADQDVADSLDTINSLAVVLSSSGSLFALSPPNLRAERRDAHRRMRRGKQRRSRPTSHVQPRLFDRTSSK
jgi:nucleotidyltransferase/DNA polymerase involved in DNA repair